VEAILGERRAGKQHQFLVKYKGYPKPSWQPASNVEHLNLLIASYRAGRRDNTTVLSSPFLPLIHHCQQEDSDESKTNKKRTRATILSSPFFLIHHCQQEDSDESKTNKKRTRATKQAVKQPVKKAKK
jgi:hypothetical protein